MKTKAEFLEELDATQKAVNDLIAELAAGASLSDLLAAGASWSYLRKWINSLPDDKSANN